MEEQRKSGKSAVLINGVISIAVIAIPAMHAHFSHVLAFQIVLMQIIFVKSVKVSPSHSILISVQSPTPPSFTLSLATLVLFIDITSIPIVLR
jgi:hypothetical protein